MVKATSNRASARRVGRPGGEHGNRREALIDAAIEQYTRVGMRATSLSAIARTAGVTPAMLHYYFGDKQQLQQAVVEERLLPAVEPLRTRMARVGDDPAEAVGAFVHGVGKMVARHPWLPPLWVREVLCEGGELREILFDHVLSTVPRGMGRQFAAAQARGQLNPDLDPRLLVVSLVALTLFPLAGAPIWRRVFEADDIDSDTLLRHTLALLQGGLGLPAPGDEPR